jgi:hypothetical protein
VCVRRDAAGRVPPPPHRVGHATVFAAHAAAAAWGACGIENSRPTSFPPPPPPAAFRFLSPRAARRARPYRPRHGGEQEQR